MLMIEPWVLFKLKHNFLAERSPVLKRQAGIEDFWILDTQLIMLADYIDPNTVRPSGRELVAKLIRD